MRDPGAGSPFSLPSREESRERKWTELVSLVLAAGSVAGRVWEPRGGACTVSAEVAAAVAARVHVWRSLSGNALQSFTSAEDEPRALIYQTLGRLLA